MATKNSKVIPIKVRVNGYNALAEKEENIIGQRIAESRKKLGMSQKAFAEHLASFGLEIGTAAESQWETGRTAPNAYQLVAICAALDIGDIRFFTKKFTPVLNEEGEKKVADYKSDLVASGKYRPVTRLRSVIRSREMPISSLMASAGTGTFLDEGSFETLSFPESEVPDAAEFGIQISGDSMEPRYHDGQIAWVQQCDALAVGEIGIFVVDGDGYIKCYDEQEPDEDIRDEYVDSYGILHNQPVLISLNEKYPPRVIAPSSEFRLVGRVLN